VLTTERDIADFFEAAVNSAPEIAPEKLANWLSGPFFAQLNQLGLSIQEVPTTPEQFAELVGTVEQGDINAASGKIALNQMIQTGKSAADLVEELNLRQVSDPETIQALVVSVLESNPEQVRDYLAGKEAIAQWLFGQVMREGGGKANPSEVQKALQKALRSIDENHPSA
jgi:aspartyl-tRNA(Asn)/glutamyl-tRNA(Gln) amidotransferase subunit B